MDPGEERLDEGGAEWEGSSAPASRSMFIGTSNRGFSKLAVSELHRLFGKVKTEMLSPGDVFRFETALPREEALRRILSRPPIFLRHIQPADAVLPLMGKAETLRAIVEAVAAFRIPLSGKRIAVQARRAEGPRAPLAPIAPIEVKRAVDALLEESGAVPAVQGMEIIISVYLARDAVYAGWSEPKDNLSDWSGGAVHFRKEDGDISRAKYKLMEAEKVFGLDFAAHRNALDLGAAPGGWTSYLLEKGLFVTAVDPAMMHPELSGHPGLVHLRMNAADVTFPSESFDLLVCDMSWDARRMAGLVKRLLPAVKAGAPVLTTVKLMHGKAFATLRGVESVLAPEAELVRARQLFHNREEITCLWRRKRPDGKNPHNR